MEQIRREKLLNIPNILTVARIALLPAVVWRFRAGDMMGALALYLIAMLTDVFDGMIARQLSQITSFGKLLDPVADKLFLITLLWLFVSDGQIPHWVLAVVLIREAALIAGSIAALKCGIVAYALPIGKLTTALFIFSMIARFLSLKSIADSLLEISLAFSLAALFRYAVVMMRRVSEYNTFSTK